MRFFRLGTCAFFSGITLWGQLPTAPVVPPRGVVNAYSMQPAPSTAAPGGILYVQGLNLGPAAGWKADGLPLPTQFGEPATQVLINNRPAPLFEATPSRIMVQIPYETPGGLATLIVRRGEQQSRPVRLQINAIAPSLLSANGLGKGAAADSGTGSTLRLRVTSLGLLSPPMANGTAAGEDNTSQPRQALSAMVGGLPANFTARASAMTPGEFEIDVVLPDGAQAGDPVLLVEGPAMANLLTYQAPRKRAEFLYLPLSEGATDIRSLRSSDTRGVFVVANGPRSTDGCYPSYVFDFAAAKVRNAGGCLTASARQAQSPFTNGVNGPTFAAFEGPFAGNVAGQVVAPVSDKVRIFRPGTTSELTARLPGAASTLATTDSGDFVAVIAGEAGQAPKTLRIDAATGAVEDMPIGAAGGGAGGAAGPGQIGGAGANLLQRFSTIDLGDGINKALSQPAQLVNQILVVGGDDLDAPTKARVGVYNAQGDLTAQRNFPEGWLPLVAPAAPPVAQPPAGVPVPGGANAIRFPTPVFGDGGTRILYVPARNAEGKHALIVFPATGDARAIDVPEGWVFTSCTANLPIFMINLANQIAMAASKNEDRSFKNPCLADGYLTIDLATRQLRAISLPGSGQLNLSAGAVDINDFLVGSNTDPARRNTSDTLYVLDGVNASALRFDLPPGVNNFSGLNPLPNLNLVVAQANNRTPGDAGIVLFDLERTEARLLPTPDGFASIQFLGIFSSVQKLAARGILANNAGAQILIYDLENGDLEILANAGGAAWFGTPVQVAAGPGGQPGGQGGAQPGGPALVNLPIRANLKANTIEGMLYDAARQASGIAVVRVF